MSLVGCSNRKGEQVIQDRWCDPRGRLMEGAAQAAQQASADGGSTEEEFSRVPVRLFR
jgi:hypothetical protein